MSTLIFDIETVGEKWDDFENVTKEVLTRWVNKTARNPDEKNALNEDIKAGLGFSPLTGFVVAIGIYDLERKQGVVYYTGNGGEKDEVSGEYTYKERSEEKMLLEFWEGAQHYDTFVTFNGRGFDVPFLLHRSVVHQIKPTKNLMESRYPSQQESCRHVDLQDELTFFGAVYRKPSLHLFCRAYGIESPKGEVSGDYVAELFTSKKFRDIAHYNDRDVVATTALYQKWLEYLKFENTEDLILDF